MPLPKQFPRTASGKAKAKPEARILANRYQIEKRLGSGKFGTAFLVIDIRCKEDRDKLKVLKEIPVGDLQPDETVDAMHESSLLRNLDHPGIVRFHNSFIEGNFFCIVTEFCEGGDLDQKVIEFKKKNKKIAEAQVIEWIIQLLLSVEYMHDRKVLHRDLKTSNIFLKNNMIKVGDFGISRILMSTTDMASTFVGTPYFMSPEVLKHEGYNSKSDVWSVGSILYELCTLKHAFDGQSLMGVMYKIVEGELPEWPVGYSKELKRVFQSILIKDPTKRPSAGEVLKIPFISHQMEIMKNTMIDKHQNKEHKENLHSESQQIYNALKESKRVAQLREESEAQRLKNMSPRERMRLRKQQQADEEARRMRAAALQQLVDNKIKYNEIRQNQNPYDTKRLDREEVAKARSEMTDLIFGNRPKTAPVPDDQYIIEDSDAEDEGDGDLSEGEAGRNFHSEEMQTVVAAANVQKPSDARPRQKPSFHNPQKKGLSHTVHSSNPGLQVHDPNTLSLTVGGDDRPITPMKNRMIYDVEHSTLDFKDGVPENPSLAETYYSQYEDEFEGAGDTDLSSGEEDNEGTLAAIGEGAGDEEVEDLINVMQNALDKSETLKSQTLTDISATDAFGPTVRSTKIKNLYEQARKKLGEEEFERAYSYLKEARFPTGQGGEIRSSSDENAIMKGLSRIVKNPNDCFLVDQLLFLEIQAQLAEM